MWLWWWIDGGISLLICPGLTDLCSSSPGTFRISTRKYLHVYIVRSDSVLLIFPVWLVLHYFLHGLHWLWLMERFVVRLFCTHVVFSHLMSLYMYIYIYNSSSMSVDSFCDSCHHVSPDPVVFWVKMNMAACCAGRWYVTLTWHRSSSSAPSAPLSASASRPWTTWSRQVGFNFSRQVEGRRSWKLLRTYCPRSVCGSKLKW